MLPTKPTTGSWLGDLDALKAMGAQSVDIASALGAAAEVQDQLEEAKQNCARLVIRAEAAEFDASRRLGEARVWNDSCEDARDERDAAIQRAAAAERELHEWRTKRTHGGCQEDLMAEVGRRAEAETQRDELRASLAAAERENAALRELCNEYAGRLSGTPCGGHTGACQNLPANECCCGLMDLRKRHMAALDAAEVEVEKCTACGGDPAKCHHAALDAAEVEGEKCGCCGAREHDDAHCPIEDAMTGTPSGEGR